jgi:hypothetical protein
LAFIVVTFLRCDGTRAKLAIIAVQNIDDTPAPEGLQAAQPRGKRKAALPKFWIKF